MAIRSSCFRVAFVIGLMTAGPATPCVQAQAASPINDLLASAKAALNDLKFARADTVAQEVLALATSLRRSQTVLAWEIVAAARFPEEGATRDTAGARRALREVVRLDLDASLPVDISWSGLAALLAEEKRAVFGLAVRVPNVETVFGGSKGDAIVRVATSHPATFWLLARARDGSTEIALDSVPEARDAALRVRALRGTVPVLLSGAYEFVIRARETPGGALLERTLQASLTVPVLELLSPAPPLDTSKLLPELRKTSRTKAIAGGVIVGALTIALNQSLRADAPLSKTNTDGRATTVGVAITAGTIAAVWFDPGQALNKNREANAQLRRAATQRAVEVAAENERRISGYRAKLTLLAEEK
jgi:hypothetical protein